MPRRWRLERPSGPTVLGVVVAGALVVALVMTGRLLNVPRSRPSAPAGPAPAAAPYRIGERLVCPLRHPVLATSAGRSYPPGRPTEPPPDVRPVACFETADLATAAGYPPAPLPAGVLDLGGEYLVRTSVRLRRQCRQAANRVGFAVPCPTLLPPLEPSTVPPAPCELPSTCTPGSGFLFEVGGFTVPAGRIVAYQNFGGQLVIAAAKRPTAFAVSCDGERPVAQATVRGHPGLVAECPDDSSPNGGVLVRWRERNTFLVVSISGRGDLHRRLILAVAAHLALVPPGR
jgi:hypothetical protein